MPMQLEGVPPSTVLLQRLADEGKVVILNFSRGKDSLAAWVAMRDYGIPVTAIHKSCPPGLSFVDESLAYYESVFGQHIIDLPSYGMYRMLKQLIYQPPERCAIIEGTDLPVLTREEYDLAMRAMYGYEDTWIVDGVRGSDSMTRRMAMMKQGPVQENQRRMSIIWDWKKPEVYGRLKAEGIELPPDYMMFGRSFDAIRYDMLAPIREHYPHDFELIREWFPLVDMEMLRGDNGYLG